MQGIQAKCLTWCASGPRFYSRHLMLCFDSHENLAAHWPGLRGDYEAALQS